MAINAEAGYGAKTEIHYTFLLAVEIFYDKMKIN